MAFARVRLTIVVVSVLVSVVAISLDSVSSATTTVAGVTPYSATEIPNPLRGQHENMLTPLFPQSNSAQSSYPAWPQTFDRSDRIEWKTLQPKDPRTIAADAPDSQRYDFSRIDRGLADAAAQGKRFAFRVTSYNSCCDSSYQNNVNASVPSWLRSVQGATQDIAKDGVTHVIPNWNSEGYLGNVEALIIALGARYNNDERLAWFEFSGYGDWSENQVDFMKTKLGRPGPSGSASVQQLGYYSQYGEQYITKASITRLVTAHLNSFNKTQIVTAPNNPEIVRQLLMDSPLISTSARPVGLRADCLGGYDPAPWWMRDPDGYYVKTNDPVLTTTREQWRKAPIATEWCNFIPSGTKQQYYEKAVRDVVNSHISIMSSTGFPDQFATTKMDSTQFALWSKANKFSGYRYAVTGATVPNSVDSGSPLAVSVSWTNFGSAPTYERWQVVYEIRDAGGGVVRTVNSPLDIRTLYAQQNYTSTAAEPAAKTVADVSSVPTAGLPSGNYSLVARVRWNEHKSGGTNTVNFAPMSLAQGSRDSTGAYPVGQFSVKQVSTTPPVTTTTPPVTTTTTTPPFGEWCPPRLWFCH